jgi:hypothetical protein
MKLRACCTLLLAVATAPAAAANLVLQNTSVLPVSLEIPGVMDPTLYPLSKSYVTLEPGQEIYFDHRGKRTLLLRVSDEKDGTVLVVNRLIAERKRELEAAEKG